MSKELDQAYRVGYGKPPLRTRFKKGVSGNPLGRPRGAKTLITLVAQELSKPVVIRENGLRKVITKREVISKQIVSKAANGDIRTADLLLRLEQSPEASGLREEQIERQNKLALVRAMTPDERQTYRDLLKKAKSRQSVRGDFDRESSGT